MTDINSSEKYCTNSDYILDNNTIHKLENFTETIYYDTSYLCDHNQLLSSMWSLKI